MAEQQRVRAIRGTGVLDVLSIGGIQFSDGEGERLANVEAVLNAWARGGLTIKDPNNDEIVGQWIRR